MSKSNASKKSRIDTNLFFFRERGSQPVLAPSESFPGNVFSTTWMSEVWNTMNTFSDSDTRFGTQNTSIWSTTCVCYYIIVRFYSRSCYTQYAIDCAGWKLFQTGSQCSRRHRQIIQKRGDGVKSRHYTIIIWNTKRFPVITKNIITRDGEKNNTIRPLWSKFLGFLEIALEPERHFSTPSSEHTYTYMHAQHKFFYVLSFFAKDVQEVWLFIKTTIELHNSFVVRRTILNRTVLSRHKPGNEKTLKN